MTFNPLIHRRKSVRLKDYDYSQEGLYFITICTKNREYLFGEIIDTNPNEAYVKLSTIGEIAERCLLQIPKHFPDTILHEFIVMPNHVHGIIQIRRQTVGAQYLVPSPLHQTAQFQKVISGSIASIMRGHKSGVTIWCRQNADIYTIWQRSYHEHIIRNEAEYNNNIRNYILNNPGRRKEDKL